MCAYPQDCVALCCEQQEQNQGRHAREPGVRLGSVVGDVIIDRSRLMAWVRHRRFRAVTDD